MAQKQTTRICREGYYYLIVLGFVITGAVLREINLLLALAGLMAGPFLLDWRLGVDAMLDLSVRRRLPDRVGAGELLVVDFLLEKKRRRYSLLQLPSRAVVVEDTITLEQIGKLSDKPTGKPTGDPQERSQARAIAWQIKCGERKRVSYRGRFHRRGRYRLGPLRLSSRFPIGLVSRTLLDETSQTVTVFPRLGQLGEAWHRLYQENVGGSQRRPAQQAAREGEFHGLRDWQHGDVRRWIHWRTTARRGVPVVRQFERHFHQEFVLLVDLAPSGATGNAASERRSNEEDEAIETTISFAATIVMDVCRRAEGSFVMAVGGAARETIRGTASTPLSLRMLDALAVAQPGVVDDLPDLLTRGLDGVKPGIPIVLVTTRSKDFADGTYFEEMRDDPRQRALLDRLRIVDVLGEHFAEYFHPAGDIRSEAAVQRFESTPSTNVAVT